MYMAFSPCRCFTFSCAFKCRHFLFRILMIVIKQAQQVTDTSRSQSRHRFLQISPSMWAPLVQIPPVSEVMDRIMKVCYFLKIFLNLWLQCFSKQNWKMWGVRYMYVCSLVQEVCKFHKCKNYHSFISTCRSFSEKFKHYMYIVNIL